MGLPKIKHSIYKHYLHGLGKEVSFRGFTNAEKKILLIAKAESEDDVKSKRIIESVVQILNNCILDDIDVESLPIFDVEDIFIRIRAKSSGEIINTRFSYDYEDENGATKTDFVNHNVNIDDIKVKIYDDHEKDIVVDKFNNVGIRMKYPTLKSYETYNDSGTLNSVSMIKSCVEFVYDSEQVFQLSDFTDDEILEFFDDFEEYANEGIKKFFNTMPRLEHSFTLYYPKLDKSETKTIRGLNDFFI